MKRTSTITEIMPADIQTVWGIVTDNEHYHWRSDLERIDVLDGGERFIEYTKDGFSTEFIITRIESCYCYEFDMQTKIFTGHWIGKYESTGVGETKLTYTETIRFSNPLLGLISYLCLPLKRIQKAYMDDLRKALKEKS